MECENYINMCQHRIPRCFSFSFSCDDGGDDDDDEGADGDDDDTDDDGGGEDVDDHTNIHTCIITCTHT